MVNNAGLLWPSERPQWVSRKNLQRDRALHEHWERTGLSLPCLEALSPSRYGTLSCLKQRLGQVCRGTFT
jgi:hypothetical protein